MSRISTLCVLSATLAVFALSANGASAEPVSVHTNIPTFKPPPPPKTNPDRPPLSGPFGMLV